MTARRPPRLVFRVATAERSLRRWLDARSGETGIGAAGAAVLFFLERRDGATLSDVSAALGASSSATSGLVTRLEAGGLVDKATGRRDGRAVSLALTSRGRAALAQAHVVLDDLNVRLAEGFTEDELATVDRWLHHVAASLSE